MHYVKGLTCLNKAIQNPQMTQMIPQLDTAHDASGVIVSLGCEADVTCDRSFINRSPDQKSIGG